VATSELDFLRHPKQHFGFARSQAQRFQRDSGTEVELGIDAAKSRVGGLALPDQPGLDGSEQVVGIDRFNHVVVRTQIHPGTQVLPFPARGQENERDAGGLGHGAQQAQCFMPIELGHRDVAENHVRLLARDHFQSDAAIGGGHGFESLHL
jgi:hypothetical protein